METCSRQLSYFRKSSELRMPLISFALREWTGKILLQMKIIACPASRDWYICPSSECKFQGLYEPLAQRIRAADYGSAGHRFESYRAHFSYALVSEVIGGIWRFFQGVDCYSRLLHSRMCLPLKKVYLLQWICYTVTGSL